MTTVTALQLPQRALRIMIAEDDPDDRILVAEALREVYSEEELESVEDGEQLLEYLRREGQFAHLAGQPLPDLILLDLNMPKMDGREALGEIKGDPELRRIPIVVFTTSRADEDVLRSYDLGVNSFVVKPSSFEGLVRAMRTIIEYWCRTCALPSHIPSTAS